MENMQLPAGWAALLRAELSAPYFAGLMQKGAAAYAAGAVFPPQEDVFAAFRLTPQERVRAVILGQEPYQQPGQAHGLAFSVRDGVRMPPSLVNIGKELASDVDATLSTGCLTGWAEQGVFLLNTVLTVEQGRANSHSGFGWQRFTDAAVAALAQLPQPVAFVLWGAQAQKKAAACKASPHPRLVLEAPHPSPLSAYRGFFGSRPFSQINAFLAAHGEAPINWNL